MRLLAVLAFVVVVPIAASAQPRSQDQSVLLRQQLGREVDIQQSIATSDGGYVAFVWTKDGRKTSQVAHCGAKTCIVVASWRDIRNCDDGMCDHFSTVDTLGIAGTFDLDGDGSADAVLDFATITGDQGRESHRFAVWMSKSRALKKLGTIAGAIDSVASFSAGVVVTTHDGFTGDPTSTTHCFGKAGAMKCPAKL
jgi:hypothetical protein